MEINMKKIAKFTGAACAATGVVVLSGLVASGAAVGAVVQGFKAAASTMKKMLEDETPVEEVQPEEAQSGHGAAAVDTQPEQEASAENTQPEHETFAAQEAAANASVTE